MSNADLAGLNREVWVSGREGRRLSGTTAHKLLSLAASGAVRTVALPGQAIRYHKEDCVGVAAAIGAGVTEAAR